MVLKRESGAHFNGRGEASMVDVGLKDPTRRCAVAGCEIEMKPEIFDVLRHGHAKKGDAFTVAKIAGINAAKRTQEMIPLCHPLALEHVEVRFSDRPDRRGFTVEAEVRTTGKTGAEMEALLAVSVAALTLYDMAKGYDPSMSVGKIHLIRKTGGKSDYEARTSPHEATDGKRGQHEKDNSKALADFKTAVLTASDRCSRGERQDLSGKLLSSLLEESGAEVVDYRVCPDDTDALENTLAFLADHLGCALILTTGGTGLASRDVTPEATRRVIEREIPGISEVLRRAGQEKVGVASALSRGIAGVRRKTLIINMPGSPGGVKDCFEALEPLLGHAVRLVQGRVRDCQTERPSWKPFPQPPS